MSTHVYICHHDLYNNPWPVSVDETLFPLGQPGEKYSCCKGKECFRKSMGSMFRLIKACSKVVTHSNVSVRVCASMCFFLFLWWSWGENRPVSLIKHLMKIRARAKSTYCNVDIFCKSCNIKMKRTATQGISIIHCPALPQTEVK